MWQQWIGAGEGVYEVLTETNCLCRVCRATLTWVTGRQFASKDQTQMEEMQVGRRGEEIEIESVNGTGKEERRYQPQQSHHSLHGKEERNDAPQRRNEASRKSGR